VLGEGSDLAGAHETLLLDVLARVEGRDTRLLKRLDERKAHVLPHALAGCKAA
jgi:hypothetical protein